MHVPGAVELPTEAALIAHITAPVPSAPEATPRVWEITIVFSADWASIRASASATGA